MTRVAIIGNGHLGKFLAQNLGDEFSVKRIFNRTADSLDILPLDSINEQNLSDIDLVIEVAHPMIIHQYGETILKHTNLFIGSPTCLADQNLFDKLTHLALSLKRKIVIPSGAFWGANDVRKLNDVGALRGLTVSMTKHPTSFKINDPGMRKKLEECKQEPVVLYEGSVRGLCPLAPNNVNTMACGAIAATRLGFDNVTARLIADPNLIDWHIVQIDTVGPDGFTVSTCRKNPAKPGAVTGQLTYYSFLASVKESQYKPIGVHLC